MAQEPQAQTQFKEAPHSAETNRNLPGGRQLHPGPATPTGDVPEQKQEITKKSNKVRAHTHRRPRPHPQAQGLTSAASRRPQDLRTRGGDK